VQGCFGPGIAFWYQPLQSIDGCPEITGFVEIVVP
jgi:hypothetical protein